MKKFILLTLVTATALSPMSVSAAEVVPVSVRASANVDANAGFQREERRAERRPKGKPNVAKAMMVAKYALNVARNDKLSATKTTTAVRLRWSVAKLIRTTSSVLNASKTAQNVDRK